MNEEVLLTEGAKANTGRVINHSNLEGSQEVQRHRSTFILHGLFQLGTHSGETGGKSSELPDLKQEEIEFPEL